MRNKKEIPKTNFDFNQTIKNYEKLRERRATLFQGLFISFLVSLIILIMEAIPKEFLFVKIGIIFVLAMLSWKTYSLWFVQSQKPVFCAQNMMGTIEKQHIIKDENGEKYVVMSISNPKHWNQSKNQKQIKTPPTK